MTGKNVPALRFPGFEGEWTRSRLGKRTVKVGSGVTPRGGATSYVPEGIPLLRSQNVRDSFLDLSDVAFITPETHASMSGSQVRDGDVLLNITGASIGRSCVVPAGSGEANVNQHVCIIRLQKDDDPKFLQAFIASQRGQKLIFETQAGGGREGLNFEAIKAFHIHFPRRNEQEKIAAFLGAVDEKINGLEKKKALLTEYKRGVMQKLFSQELRFKDDQGRDFPDWEEKRLGDDLLQHVERVPVGSDIPVYSSSREGLQLQKDYFADRERTNEGEYGVVPDGFMTYRHMSDDLTFKFNINSTGGKIAVSKEYPVFSAKTFDVRFLCAWLNNGPEFVRFAAMQKLGGTRTRLYFGVLKGWRVTLPSPREQRKIADFLSAIDSQIAHATDEISEAKTFKKGLLQQMFV